jgi:hypothetical protein
MKTNRSKKSNQTTTIVPSNINFKISRECFQNNKPDIASNRNIDALNTISRYYNFLGKSYDEIQDTEVNNCFAVRLALFLIDLISNSALPAARSGGLKKNFFRQCLEKAAEEHLFKEIDDQELLIIYIKQCLHLLQISGILKKSDKRAFIIDDVILSGKSLYYKLFKAFWVDAEWEVIFPSDIETARDLKINKNILKDLLLKNYGKTRLDKVANEFFDMTGFTSCNDLVMISFLDFYFFTWLKHFNLVLYYDDSLYAPVYISVTDSGRKILNLVS